MSETSQSADLHVNSPLNPFKVNDNVISKDISIHHDGAQVVSKDVDSLFEVASEIVRRSRLTNFTPSLGLKHVTVDVVENKVPESAFRPTYSQLKKIVSQMTCHSFNESNAHESVVGVLKKLKSYKWDAKVVIALSAFALDFGETRRRLSLMQVRNKKENGVELHMFRLAEEELDSTLVDNTLELIKGIIKLEKFDDKSCKARLDVYTYWAIFSIFACANNQVEPSMKDKLVEKLDSALAQIGYLPISAKLDNLSRRTKAASQIQQPLKALINPNKDVDHFQIIANDATKKPVNIEELQKKNLFLLISGLDKGDDLHWIGSLKSKYDSIIIPNDDREKNLQILWVPVVTNWSDEADNKFESVKSSMPPIYVLQYSPSPFEGYEVLRNELKYQDRPIVAEADTSGKIVKRFDLIRDRSTGIFEFIFNSLINNSCFLDNQ